MPQSLSVNCTAHGRQPRRVAELVLVTDVEADADFEAQRRHAALATSVLGRRPGWVAHEPQRRPTGIALRERTWLRPRRGGLAYWTKVETSSRSSRVASTPSGARLLVLRCPHEQCRRRPVVVAEIEAARLVLGGRDVSLDSLRQRRQGRAA